MTVFAHLPADNTTRVVACGGCLRVAHIYASADDEGDVHVEDLPDGWLWVDGSGYPERPRYAACSVGCAATTRSYLRDEGDNLALDGHLATAVRVHLGDDAALLYREVP